MKKKKECEYIYANDPIIECKVCYIVVDGYAISLETGHRFKYNKRMVVKK